MEYKSNIIPTMAEVNSGSLEPTSAAFKGYVGIVRGAPIYAGSMIVVGFLANIVGVAPASTLNIVGQGVGAAVLMAGVGVIQIARTRKPTVGQIGRLTHLVRLDPSLATKVDAMEERDYTFKKLQRFILEHSARANEKEMGQALDELDDAVHDSD